MEENSFASITKKYRRNEMLSQKNFGAAICVAMNNFSLTPQAISLWENGSPGPSLEDLFRVYLNCSDWRKDWAIDSLVARVPDVLARAENGAWVVK